MVVKSDEKRLTVLVQAFMRRPLAEQKRVGVEWDKVSALLAGYLGNVRMDDAQRMITRARIGMLTAIEEGKPERHAWIYAMHNAGFPAAPRVKP